jgi:hypothetical protein
MGKFKMTRIEKPAIRERPIKRLVPPPPAPKPPSTAPKLPGSKPLSYPKKQQVY